MKKNKRAIVNKGNFDGIANKFDANIYGTSKGKLRHQLLMTILEPYLHGPRLNVLDIGGGTGMMTQAFAERGHKVTLVDISKEALDIAAQRLASFDSVNFVNLDFATSCEHPALEKHSFDLVLSHAVLEWLEQPLQHLTEILQFLRPQASLSLMFFNRDAKLFNNLLYANFDYVEKGMPAKNTVRLNPHNPQKPKEVLDYIAQQQEVEVLSTHGIRCIHDYMLDQHRAQTEFATLAEMEYEYGAQEPYKWLGKYFHIMLKARE